MLLTSVSSGEPIYGSALQFSNTESFTTHLHARSAHIKSAIADLFGRLSTPPSPDVESLRRQLNDALAREKVHVVELRAALDAQESLNERLESASYRYVKAEKQLDRAKSAQVLKLEKQAIMGGGGDVMSPTTSKKAGNSVVKKEQHPHGETTNGEPRENGVTSSSLAEAESLHRETLAVLDRQKAQVSDLEAENARLTNELSAARTRLASLSDDDYAATPLFQHLTSHFSVLTSRVNDLEATNSALRAETQRLQAERSAYRRQVDEDFRGQLEEVEGQVARAEGDLARIRCARDELVAENAVLRVGKEGRGTGRGRELVEAWEERVRALEGEVERRKISTAAVVAVTHGEGEEEEEEEVEVVGVLKGKIRALEQQHALLSNELASMEAAWRKTSALAQRRVEEAAAQEDALARLQAEKAKADQKYFAAMKAKDLRDAEVRVLKSQNARSADIVSQLKEAEGKMRELVVVAERAAAEKGEAVRRLEGVVRSAEVEKEGLKREGEGWKRRVEELGRLVGEKDEAILKAEKGRREGEVEGERLRVKVEEARSELKGLLRKREGVGGGGKGGEDEWRVGFLLFSHSFLFRIFGPAFWFLFAD